MFITVLHYRCRTCFTSFYYIKEEKAILYLDEYIVSGVEQEVRGTMDHQIRHLEIRIHKKNIVTL